MAYKRDDQGVWDDYRARRVLFWFAFAAYLPGTVIAAFTLCMIMQTKLCTPIAALIWLGFFAFAGARKNMFPFPRCGKCFFSR